MNIEYDHSKLSMTLLHKEGIRSTKELEEVIEWHHSHCDYDAVNFGFPVSRFTGLTTDCKGIRVVLTFDNSGRFVTLDAKMADRDILFELLG